MTRARRDFLKTAAIATVAATACGSLACSCGSKKHDHAATGEKVKLLSPDGEIVEIDSSQSEHHHQHSYGIKSGSKKWYSRKKICDGG